MIQNAKPGQSVNPIIKKLDSLSSRGFTFCLQDEPAPAKLISKKYYNQPWAKSGFFDFRGFESGWDDGYCFCQFKKQLGLNPLWER